MECDTVLLAGFMSLRMYLK